MTNDETTLRLFDWLADSEQKKLRQTFVERHRKLAQSGESLRSSITTIRSRGWTTHDRLWSPCLFLNTASHDHSILVYDLAYERDDWKRRFVARLLALVTYEIGEDLPTVFGRDFRASAAILNVPDELVNNLSAATKLISAHWHQSKTVLQEIRVIAAAHRDHDPIRLHDTIDRIDMFELLAQSIDFGCHLVSLGEVSQQIVTFASSVTPPELATT